MSAFFYMGLLCWPGAAVFLWVTFMWEKQRRRRVTLENKIHLSESTTAGKIDTHRVTHLRGMYGRRPLYFLGYSYEIKGIRYQRSHRVSVQDFNAWREGIEVTVCYLPDDPQIASLEDISNAYLLKRLRYTSIGFFSIAVFCFAVPFVCFLSR